MKSCFIIVVLRRGVLEMLEKDHFDDEFDLEDEEEARVGAAEHEIPDGRPDQLLAARGRGLEEVQTLELRVLSQERLALTADPTSLSPIAILQRRGRLPCDSVTRHAPVEPSRSRSCSLGHHDTGKPVPSAFIQVA